MPLPLLVTPDKKRKTESICESSGIKLRSSQELHVNQALSVCVSGHDPASVYVFVCVRSVHNCTHTHTHTDPELSSGCGGGSAPTLLFSFVICGME